MNLLLDVAPIGGAANIAAAAIFLLVFMGVAFLVFKLLKRTVKMAVRIVIVAIILAIAVAGSVALWAVGTGTTERPRPTRPR